MQGGIGCTYRPSCSWNSESLCLDQTFIYETADICAYWRQMTFYEAVILPVISIGQAFIRPNLSPQFLYFHL